MEIYARWIRLIGGPGHPPHECERSLATEQRIDLLARRPDGIFVAPFEQGEIGPDQFRVACNMGLESMVSKRGDRPYRAG